MSIIIAPSPSLKDGKTSHSIHVTLGKSRCEVSLPKDPLAATIKNNELILYPKNVTPESIAFFTLMGFEFRVDLRSLTRGGDHNWTLVVHPLTVEGPDDEMTEALDDMVLEDLSGMFSKE